MPIWLAPPGTPPPPEEAPWVELEPAPELPSALDEIVPEDASAETAAPATASVRARWYVRPRVAVTVLDDGWHPDLGLVVGHQWWKFTDVALAPAGETRLVATLPLGVPGYDLALSTTAGLWLARRAGLFVGPRVDADRTRWNDSLTDRAIVLGPLARLVVDLGPVKPWFEIEPAWIVAGPRPPIADAPWDAFSERAGLLLGERFMLKLDGAHETTGSGERWEASVGVHFRVG
jgi:hypothetical protein